MFYMKVKKKHLRFCRLVGQKSDLNKPWDLAFNDAHIYFDVYDLLTRDF